MYKSYSSRNVYFVFFVREVMSGQTQLYGIQIMYKPPLVFRLKTIAYIPRYHSCYRVFDMSIQNTSNFTKLWYARNFSSCDKIMYEMLRSCHVVFNRSLFIPVIRYITKYIIHNEMVTYVNLLQCSICSAIKSNSKIIGQ